MQANFDWYLEKSVCVFEAQKFSDKRGFFSEIYNKEFLQGIGILDTFVQDNFSYSKEDENDSAVNLAPEEQHLRLHLKRLPGNRITTIVKGFIGNDKTLKDLSKMLKKSCGVGGSVKNQQILIQGNHREKILKLLLERGFKVKVSGG